MESKKKSGQFLAVKNCAELEHFISLKFSLFLISLAIEHFLCASIRPCKQSLMVALACGLTLFTGPLANIGSGKALLAANRSVIFAALRVLARVKQPCEMAARTFEAAAIASFAFMRAFISSLSEGIRLQMVFLRWTRVLVELKPVCACRDGQLLFEKEKSVTNYITNYFYTKQLESDTIRSYDSTFDNVQSNLQKSNI